MTITKHYYINKGNYMAQYWTFIYNLCYSWKNLLFEYVTILYTPVLEFMHIVEGNTREKIA